MRYFKYIFILNIGILFFYTRPVLADCCGQVVCDGPVGSQCKHACSNWWPCTCTCSATCGGSVPQLPPPHEPPRPPEPTSIPRPTSTPAPIPTATPTNTPTPTVTPSPTPRLPTRTITQPLTGGLTSQSSSMKVTNSFSGVTEEPVLRQVCLVTQDCSIASNGCTVQKEHRVRLTTKPGYTAEPEMDAYITECLLIGGSSICTTGDSTTDANYFGFKLNGKSNLDYLSNSPAIGYKFNGLFKIVNSSAMRTSNPVASDSKGNLGVYEWESRTQNQYERLFFAVNNLSDTGFARGNGGSMKQGTWAYENTAQNCVIIAWDPSGYIIDKQSDKPVSHATVTLLIENKDNSFVTATSKDIPGNFINPLTTDHSGFYNFQVPKGKYKLQVTHPDYEKYISETIDQEGANHTVNIYLKPHNIISTIYNSLLNIIH